MSQNALPQKQSMAQTPIRELLVGHTASIELGLTEAVFRILSAIHLPLYAFQRSSSFSRIAQIKQEI
jgi:hypothetical protein